MQSKLYRRSGSLLYWLRYQDERGFPVEHCTGTVNLAEAEILAAQLGGTCGTASRAAPHKTKDPENTVAQALAQFVETCRIDRSPATIECYQQKGGHLVRLLGDMQLCSLSVDHVTAYCKKRLEEGAARESVRKELVVLRATLGLARDRGVLGQDPTALIPKFRAKYQPRQRWMSADELAGLLRHLSAERQRWVLVAVMTGGRLSEIESLTWGALDFERGLVHLAGTKTDRANRYIPMDEGLAELLRPMRGKPGEAVAGQWKNVRRDLIKACGKAQIEPVSPNDLRRTFASWLKQAGRDSLAVGKLLGHTSSRMVELVYGHLDQKAMREAMAALPCLATILSNAGSELQKPV